MNWKEVLTILGFIIGLYMGFVGPRFDSIESSIKDLANEIRADRRATSQRIDNLYLHAKKTGK